MEDYVIKMSIFTIAFSLAKKKTWITLKARSKVNYLKFRLHDGQGLSMTNVGINKIRLFSGRSQTRFSFYLDACSAGVLLFIRFYGI